MTPPDMTDEQIMCVACASPIRDTYWLSPKLETYPDEVREITAFAKAIIAARDKQWAEMLGEPVAYLAWRDGKPSYEGDDAVCEEAVWPVEDGDNRTSMPVYAPKQEKPE